MRSPQDMEIIQIDITNACVNRCSNCTRFCGHHTKPFFMDFETFKQAVDSFEGYEGCVGIIGGEPTLHPEFEKFVDYLRDKRIGKTFCLSREPIEEMQRQIYDKLQNTASKTGLWCSLNKGYYKHFEVINDSFDWQLLNDHNNKCLHQAILMARKDLNIPDKEFIARRDKCFAQNTWSATVTPKGAFFCEIAAALDILFNGPGGWKVEQGWWKRTPEEFGEQLQWCELCSLCLDVPKRISSEDIDDISPSMLEKLKAVNSPKIKQGKYCVHTLEDYNKHKNSYHSFEKSGDYMTAGANIRTTTSNKNYYPRSFVIETPEEVKNILKEDTDWVIINKEKSKYTAEKFAKYLKMHVINPGCIYKYKSLTAFNPLARSIRDKLFDIDYSNVEENYPCDKIINIECISKFESIVKYRVRRLTRIFNITRYLWI